jgi:hypothetical protein
MECPPSNRSFDGAVPGRTCQPTYDDAESIITSEEWRLCERCRAVLEAWASPDEEETHRLSGARHFTSKIYENSNLTGDFVSQECPVCLLTFGEMPSISVEQPATLEYYREVDGLWCFVSVDLKNGREEIYRKVLNTPSQPGTKIPVS